ncbi:UNVERIFIED_CONTAM: Pleiotropic drug resistance protein 1 [Sesamum radiatum]|uniref:Pleiotropic drug resistance protein 1 n=1 Tax=Sesamum radiatum TaxID=300843 RepID=A0AAW2JT57_SESRA
MDTDDIYKGSSSMRASKRQRESFRANSSNIWRNTGIEVFSRSSREEDDEEALKWAALEKLPTFDRLRKGLLFGSKGANEVDVQSLGFQDKRNLVERLVNTVEEDNEKFLLKLRNRIDRVGIDIPTIEVRYEHLNVDAEAYTASRALPTFVNFNINLIEGILILHVLPSRKKPFTILKDTSGRITYNGHGMEEFVPQRTAAYISQHDLHIGEMTVRETLAYSARFQGVGSRYEMLAELSRREKAANIKPDPDVDMYMKAAATEGDEVNVVTDYILKVLGLDICAVGDEMIRGISGGQRKRVTTGEMLVGPAKALFMDEISTGLDSSTTYQIVNMLRQYVHIMKGTAFISLLQPAPETYDLFDDIVLLADGQIVYQGPRENVLDFFESMGFKCPERKGVADFLQEVTSKKDQKQYWANKDEPYRFIPLTVMALTAMTVFLRTKMHKDTLEDGGIYTGALFFTVIMVMFNGLTELSMTIQKLPVFYKQRDMFFFPSWAYAIPSWILKIPVTFLEVAIWTFLTYYVIGFDPNVGSQHPHCSDLLGSGRNMIVANTFGLFALLMLFALGGIVLSREDVKNWWLWGYWSSPLMYAQNAIVVNEFTGNSWSRLENGTKLGVLVMESRGFFPQAYWYWIGVGGLFGFVWLFNILYLLSLTYLKPFEKPQAVLPEETEDDAQKGGSIRRVSAQVNGSTRRSISSGSSSTRVDAIEANGDRKRGMILPFEPHSITFDDVRYSVDMPAEMKAQGATEDKLELLKGVSGAFRPGVLTALMGVSGAVYESLVYSAWLRLPREVDAETRKMFIEEVMELVELTPLRGALVGLPGVNGLSTEQRKRLTIAVELVANPSIIFMDEPTSGLDARAAAVVMRTVRNTVNTGRTVVCTIHQPSIDIFEAFDEEEQSPNQGVKRSSAWHKNLFFPTKYSQSFLTQCIACLWKQHWSYWRNPPYTAVRFLFTTFIALIFGTMFWDLGSKCTTVVAIERTVFYRERAAGMYSALPYAFSQRIPVWWRWYYWATPFAYTLYGIIVSQFGEIKDQMEGGDETVEEFLRNYFGFRHDMLGMVAAILFGFVVLFTFIFAYSIRTFNFQTR